jgi:hypothetical protein
MFTLAKLVFKSYMPLRLEKGMWFKKEHSDVLLGRVYNYFTIYELKELPHDMHEYMSMNGAPVEPYIVMPTQNKDDKEEILATPDQIGWWDQGDTADDLEDITLEIINAYVYGEDGDDGYIALEVFDSEDEEGIHRNVVFFHDKVTIRHVTFVDEHEYDDDDEDDDDYEDDIDEDDLTDYDDPEWPHDHPKDKTDYDPEPNDADHDTE